MKKINTNMLHTKEHAEKMQMRFVAGELEGLRKVIEYLWAGNQEAFNALYFIKSNYKQWPQMITWLKDNQLRGQALADMFKNESPDGGGYHMGATYILSRLKGMKHGTVGIKADELLGN